MPKINVYLPDDLAAAVREAGLSVSPICQQALAEAVQSVAVVREAVGMIRGPRFDPARHPEVDARIAARMTPHLRGALALASGVAGPGQPAGPEHLLIGVIDEPDNLGAHVLESLGADLTALREAAQALCGARVATRGGRRSSRRAKSSVSERPAPGEPLLGPLTPEARLVVATTLEAAADMGHAFLGCEHLVLGLAEPDDGPVAELLGERGITTAAIRRAIPLALAAAAVGYRNAHRPVAPVLAGRLEDLVGRLDAVEQRLADAGL